MEENGSVIAYRTIWVAVFFILLSCCMVVSVGILIAEYNLELLIMCVFCFGGAIYEGYYFFTVPKQIIVYEDGKLIINPERGEQTQILPEDIEVVTHRQTNRWYNFGTLKITVNGKEIVLRQVANLEEVTAKLQKLKNAVNNEQVKE